MPGPLENRSWLRNRYDSARWRVREYHVRQQERPFYARTGFVAAAVFVSLVAIAGVVLLLGFGEDDESSPPAAGSPAEVSEPAPSDPESVSPEVGAVTTAPPAGTTPSPGRPPAGDAGDCPPFAASDDPNAVLTTAPANKWSAVGAVPLAQSEENGPALAGPSRCYTSEPMGALLAAHNVFGDLNDSLVPRAETVAQRVHPDSPMLAELESDAEGSPSGAGSPLYPVAYRFTEVSAEQTGISLIYQSPAGSTVAYIEMALVMRWAAGDWLLWDVAAAQQVSVVPGGYVTWGPLTDLEE